MSFSQLLSQFRTMRALVVGDLMLDEYIVGRATRISPEAPVMVVKRHETRHMPGGAANVAWNLVALGASVQVAGVVGKDEGGNQLLELLRERQLGVKGVLADPLRVTTRKTRVLADHAHQVLRIDHESDEPLDDRLEQSLRSALQEMARDADVIVLSDYRKGTLTERLVQETIAEARSAHKTVVANPKPVSAGYYRGASLVSLNRSEAAESLSRAVTPKDAEERARELQERIGSEAVLITLGDAGMVAAGAETVRAPAPKVEVYDTAGAGDTVIATVALGLASAGFGPEIFQLAAQTAACVVRKVGVVAPSAQDLAELANLTV